MNLRVTFSLTCAAILSLMISTGHAQTTLISDSFGGTAGPLAGSSPDIDTLNPFDTWVTSGSGWTRGPGSNLGGGFALLPFSPSNGNVYTLTLTETWSGTASGSYMWTGFTNATSGNNANYLVWWTAALGQGNSTVYAFKDNTGGGPGQVFQGAGGPANGGTVTEKIVLDTTGGTGNWTVAYFVNNVQYGSTVSLLSTDTITQLGIGGQMSGSGPVSLSSILLTVGSGPAAPEPSTWAMLFSGLGLFALVLMKRMKKVLLS